MRILFAGNQGGMPVIEFNLSLANELGEISNDLETDFVVWWKHEAEEIQEGQRSSGVTHVFESFALDSRIDYREEAERLTREYFDVNWSAVIASERSFVDASFLLGGAGNRLESLDYVTEILSRMVRFFERCFSQRRPDAIVCQTADSFFTHVLFIVAKHFEIPIFAITPAWLQERGKPGTFFTNDKYLGSTEMAQNYKNLLERNLTDEEITRADAFRDEISKFDGNKAFYSATKRNFGRSPVSPNIRNLVSYVFKNQKIDKRIDYRRFSVVAKVRANLLRLWRFVQLRKFLNKYCEPLPDKTVFFPLQFQPEQSTLVGGIFYANQVALVEAIAKSLPLGYNLVVKEHPAGRGARPVHQYRHMISFPNVQFSDLPSKEIAAQSDAVVTITGTIAVESIALDVPVIVLGRSFFDYADVLYRASSVMELPRLFRKLLLKKDYQKRQGRENLIRKFLLSYLEAIVPSFPVKENASALAEALHPRLCRVARLSQDTAKNG